MSAYSETLFDTFGPLVIGLQMTEHRGDGACPERVSAGNGSVLVYRVGAQLHDITVSTAQLVAGHLWFPKGQPSQRAYAAT